MRAASIRFLDGRHPRFTHVPPSVRTSVIAAVLPSSAARIAAANAVEPDPRMTKSNRCRMLVAPVRQLASGSAGTASAGAGRPTSGPSAGGHRLLFTQQLPSLE